jgi:hypothetical protein
MHHTDQRCKQIWTHPLPNAHLLWQLGDKQPHLKPKKQKKQNIKPNVRINILDEGYTLHNEGIAWIDRQL